MLTAYLSHSVYNVLMDNTWTLEKGKLVLA